MVRFRDIISSLLLVTVPLSLAAQNSIDGTETVATDSTDFFLLQAFHSSRRIALNHLGLIVESDDQGYRISAVLDGFPAQQAGLRRGDLLTAIDGDPFHPVFSLNPRIGDERPAPVITQPVQLDYRRNGTEMSVSLQPVYGNLFDAYRTATLNSAQQFSNGNKLIGYVKLWSLDRSADGIQSFTQLLNSLDHCDGLILDLRDSYGFVDATHIDRFFSSRNTLFELVGGNTDLWQTEQPDQAPLPAYGRAVVVLQNSGTRGGAELFSYQLAKPQRNISVGETTSGKAGRVSFNTANGSLTYRADFETLIDGMQMEPNGFEAELQVPYPLDTSLAADPQLDAAVMALLENI